MIIKCPQCGTGYNVPDGAITAKPRKMRCSRCTNVFTLHRRTDAAPAGYEEFTGKQNLPAEFAFLREAPAPAQPPPAQPVPAPPPAAAPAPAAPPPVEEGLYQRLIDQDGEAIETIPLDPPMVSGPVGPPAAPPPPPGPGPAAAGPAPAQAGIGDIYGGSRSAWETEAPMELAGFAIPDETAGATGAQTAGKMVVVGLVLIGVFFLFVAFRNGWSLSFTELPEQISFAFSGAEYEAIPSEARDIEVTVSDRRLLPADSGGQYLAVSGTVFNTAIFPLRGVVLRGRLLDSTGEIRGEARAPCGKVLEDQVIQATAPGAIDGHYRQGGVLHDCRLEADGTTVFQLIFPDVPADYGSGFTIEAQAVAAATGS